MSGPQDNTDNIRAAIKQAMLQNMTPEQQQAMIGQLNANGPMPGDIGREGDMPPGGMPMNTDGPPPIDEAAMMQQMQGMAPPGPPPEPQGPPRAPVQAGMAPPPPPIQTPPVQSPMARMAGQMVPGFADPGPAPEAAEGAFANDMDQMGVNIGDNFAQNKAMMQKLGVTPQQLQMAMQGNGAPPPPARTAQGVQPNALIQALMSMGLATGK